MKSHQTPLHELVDEGNTFLLKGDNLYLFRGIREEDASLPSINCNGIIIPATKARSYREMENSFISYDGNAENMQQKFLEKVFSESFYSADGINNLQNAQKIAQYTLGEAIPALLISYSSLIGLDLPSKNPFIGAQDIVFSKIDFNVEESSVDSMDELYETFKDAVYKQSGELFSGNDLDIEKKISANPSLFEGLKNVSDIFSIDGVIYGLDKKQKEGLKIIIDGEDFGLVEKDSGFMHKYGELFKKYILSRTLEDQKDFIEDLLPRARLGKKFKNFLNGSTIEFGSGDVRIGCYWLEDELRIGHYEGRAMVLYMQTPTMFIRGIKIRENEYDHLSKDSGLIDGELLYWKYPENKICVFVTAGEDGTLYITSPAIVEYVPHTGIAGSLDNSIFDRKGRYNLMCGVQGGRKEKPLGLDAVDVLGVALNYYQNGISPETVQRHRDGQGFMNKYDDCFPVGKGYTEAQVDAIIEEMEGNGREIWKANHMHLPLEDKADKRKGL